MASNVKLVPIFVINLIIIISLSFLPINCNQLDSEPKLLGLYGESTPSARHGWNVLLNDLQTALIATKLYQKKNPINKLISKPTKSAKNTKYSPKRSSPKCLFGTPNPQYHCGPDIVGSIMTNEYREFAQRLWNTYLLRHSFNY